jgi:hypothetical protein
MIPAGDRDQGSGIRDQFGPGVSRQSSVVRRQFSQLGERARKKCESEVVGRQTVSENRAEF